MKYIILLLTISCASNPNISPELSHYVDSFFTEYKASLDVQLGTSGNYYDRIQDHIRIKREDWEVMSPTFREMLIYHEMFHGVTFRRHLNNKWLTDGCPYSIMYYKIDESCYKKHRDHYIKEGFSRKGEFIKDKV